MIPWIVFSVGFGDFNNYTFRGSSVVPIIAMIVIALYSNFHTIYKSVRATDWPRSRRLTHLSLSRPRSTKSPTCSAPTAAKALSLSSPPR